MIRKIIKIDDTKCNGCGACANACHENAIVMRNNKAVLLRDDYCDGLGDCLPSCPTGAITFEEREASPYDEAAVKANIAKKQEANALACGCPGTQSKVIQHSAADAMPANEITSRLSQWPVQIKLAPVNAPYFDGAKLLVAADCTAFAYGNFHNEFIDGHITLIGCPKLDMTDYAEKLTAIIRQNNILSVSVVRMEVPCCGGIELAVKQALIDSEKFIPWQIYTVSTDGRLLK